MTQILSIVYSASISPFPIAHPLLHHHMQSWWEWVSRCPSSITVAEGLQSSNLRGLKEVAGVISLLRLAPYLSYSTCLANVTSVSPLFYLLSVWQASHLTFFASEMICIKVSMFLMCINCYDCRNYYFTSPQNSEWVESMVVYHRHDKLFNITQKQIYRHRSLYQ